MIRILARYEFERWSTFAAALLARRGDAVLVGLFFLGAGAGLVLGLGRLAVLTGWVGGVAAGVAVGLSMISANALAEAPMARILFVAAQDPAALRGWRRRRMLAVGAGLALLASLGAAMAGHAGFAVGTLAAYGAVAFAGGYAGPSDRRSIGVTFRPRPRPWLVLALITVGLGLASRAATAHGSPGAGLAMVGAGAAACAYLVRSPDRRLLRMLARTPLPLSRLLLSAVTTPMIAALAGGLAAAAVAGSALAAGVALSVALVVAAYHTFEILICLGGATRTAALRANIEAALAIGLIGVVGSVAVPLIVLRLILAVRRAQRMRWSA